MDAWQTPLLSLSKMAYIPRSSLRAHRWDITSCVRSRSLPVPRNVSVLQILLRKPAMSSLPSGMVCTPVTHAVFHSIRPNDIPSLYVHAVLRYTPYNKSVVDVIRSRTLGRPINIVHVEPVGYYHFAHSYVRGNWSREATSSFALLAKSCQYVRTSHCCLPLY